MTEKLEIKKKTIFLIILIPVLLGIEVVIARAYAIPSSGEFQGVNSFVDDSIGQAPAGLSISEGIGEKYTVVSQYTAASGYKGINTHTTVLQLRHTKFMQDGYVGLTFSSPATGDNQICEFWVCNPGPYSSNNVQIDIFFINSTGAIVAGMNLDAGLMDARENGAWVYDVLSYTMNSWMHFRFEFDITSKTYKITVDETRDAGTYDLPTTTDVEKVQFYTEPWYNNPADGTYNVYVDAIGYNWHPNYSTGDNLKYTTNSGGYLFGDPDTIWIVIVVIIAVIGAVLVGVIYVTQKKHRSQITRRIIPAKGVSPQTQSSPRREPPVHTYQNLEYQRNPPIISSPPVSQIQSVPVSNIPPKTKWEEDFVIIREFEYVGGQIRLKIGLTNNSREVLTNIRIAIDVPEALKWVAHDPSQYERKGDAVTIPRLGVGERKTISIFLEPTNCVNAAVNATVMFLDSRDQPHAIPMHPKMIEVSCPIFFTREDSNLARVRNLYQQLTHRDRKFLPILDVTKCKEVFQTAITEVGYHDVKEVTREYEEAKSTGEAWYYGVTKIKHNEMVIHISLDGASGVLEIEAAGNEQEMVTALLAELQGQVRSQLEDKTLVPPGGELLDMKTAIIMGHCPYCWSNIPPDKIREYKSGQQVHCPYCKITISPY